MAEMKAMEFTEGLHQSREVRFRGFMLVQPLRALSISAWASYELWIDSERGAVVWSRFGC